MATDEMTGDVKQLADYRDPTTPTVRKTVEARIVEMRMAVAQAACPGCGMVASTPDPVMVKAIASGQARNVTCDGCKLSFTALRPRIVMPQQNQIERPRIVLK
jgi:hypothetical protein